MFGFQKLSSGRHSFRISKNFSISQEPDKVTFPASDARRLTFFLVPMIQKEGKTPPKKQDIDVWTELSNIISTKVVGCRSIHSTFQQPSPHHTTPHYSTLTDLHTDATQHRTNAHRIRGQPLQDSRSIHTPQSPQKKCIPNSNSSCYY